MCWAETEKNTDGKKKSKQVKKSYKRHVFTMKMFIRHPLIRENREELPQMTPPLLPLKLQGTAYSSQVTIKLVNLLHNKYLNTT